MIEVMGKHLPPSASSLRLIDVNGEAHDILSSKRKDIDVVIVSGDVGTWAVEPSSVDAITAYAYILNDPFLQAALDALRPGGRMVVVDPNGAVHQDHVVRLERAGFSRILVEPALETRGVLIRGEKPHTASVTLDRVQLVAGKDGDLLTLDEMRGRYVHLLIREHPNKPAWARRPDELVTWKAAAVSDNGGLAVLGFSSLPRAVGFMQAAILANKIQDVNRVAKFSKTSVSNWPYQLLINPVLDRLEGDEIVWIDVDPTTAEAPDE
jgi:hypothetical protein